MLRQLCIFFLIFTCSLCYDNFEEQNFRPRRFEESKTKKVHHHKEKPKQISQYEKGKYLGYSAYDDKETVAQINVAKFIQKPSTGQDRLQQTKDFEWTAFQNSKQNNMPSYNAMDQEIQKNIPSYKTMDQEITKRKQRRSKQGFKAKDDVSKMTDFGIMSNQQEALWTDTKGSKKKKSIMTRLRKIPFFFHNNSDTVKVKGKNKKRKLFSFQRTPAKIQLTSTGIYTTEVMMNLLKVQKRSGDEQFCPMCRRPFVSKDNIRKNKRFSNIIHNCRQYYLNQKTDPKQVTYPVTKINDKMFTADNKEKGNLLESYESRIKRGVVSISDLSRQLDELNDFEKKLEDQTSQYGSAKYLNIFDSNRREVQEKV